MPGDDEYELLSHSDVEQLRREAHQGEHDLVDAVNTLKHTHESIEDLRGLLSSVKETILEDYAESPNPESVLNRIESQNEKIAESMVSVFKRMDAIEEQQEEILDKLDDVVEDDEPGQTLPDEAYADNDEDMPDMSAEENVDEDDEDFDSMPSLDGLDEEEEDDNGFLWNMMGG